ncbi:MAG: DUF3047 domain-containing protein [Vicinamibacteria bacterium]|jgi:hypothetical protein
MRISRAAAALVAFALAPAPVILAQDAAPIPRFSTATPGGPLPAGWSPLSFPHITRHTSYALVRDPEAGVVLRAEADASASGLIAKVDLPAHDWNRLGWRWKVDRPIQGGDVMRKAGDDYPARIYVAFRYTPERLGALERVRYELIRLWLGEYPPHAGLNYIWDARAPVGTVVPNPYERRVRMIVVESGTARVGRWLDYERDVLADYRVAFGEEPPPVAGVALMTDADDTGERALAYYGDVTLRRAASPGR